MVCATTPLTVSVERTKPLYAHGESMQVTCRAAAHKSIDRPLHLQRDACRDHPYFKKMGTYFEPKSSDWRASASPTIRADRTE